MLVGTLLETVGTLLETVGSCWRLLEAVGMLLEAVGMLLEPCWNPVGEFNVSTAASSKSQSEGG